MHRADIVAAVHKKGATLVGISVANGLTSSALSRALDTPFRRAEEVLINFLGLHPHAVFPTRYSPSGERLIRHGGHLKGRRFTRKKSQ